MLNYVAPVNPLHERVFDETKFGWVKDAWNEATLDAFVPDPELRYYSDAAEVSTLTNALEENSLSNLPGMLPSGEWMTDYILRHPDLEPSRAEFEAWTDHAELSRPVRLFVYGQTVLQNEAYWGSDEGGLGSLLLLAADLTEADFQFLLVDGGASVGIKSLLEAVALAGQSPSMLIDLMYEASFHGSAGLREQDVTNFLRNHSVAASTKWLPYILDSIFEKVEDASLTKVFPGTEISWLETIVRNPATPASALKTIVDYMEPEIAWLRLYSKAKSGKWSAKVAKPAIEAELARMGRTTGRLLVGSLDPMSMAEELEGFFDHVSYHPNWGAEFHHLAPRTAERDGRGSYDKPSDGLPTISDEYWMVWEHSVKERDYNYENRLCFQVLKHLAFRDPTNLYVVNGAKFFASLIARNRKVAFSELLPVAHWVGAVFQEVHDLKEAFGTALDDVPPEWFHEIAF